jgi:hypothetical protein
VLPADTQIKLCINLDLYVACARQIITSALKKHSLQSIFYANFICWQARVCFKSACMQFDRSLQFLTLALLILLLPVLFQMPLEI